MARRRCYVLSQRTRPPTVETLWSHDVPDVPARLATGCRRESDVGAGEKAMESMSQPQVRPPSATLQLHLHSRCPGANVVRLRLPARWANPSQAGIAQVGLPGLEPVHALAQWWDGMS